MHGVKLQEVLSGLEKKAKALDIHMQFVAFLNIHSFIHLLLFSFHLGYNVLCCMVIYVQDVGLWGCSHAIKYLWEEGKKEVGRVQGGGRGVGLISRKKEVR